MVIIRTGALASFVAAFVFTAHPASAGAPDRIPVDISIRADTTPRSAHARGTIVYKGKLRSEKRACENGRVVTLWRVNEGTDTKQSIGSFETGGNGKWAVVSETNNDGEYFATTPKITLSASGKICKRGRSKSIFRDVSP